MNWKNTPPSEKLIDSSENALLFESFLILVDDLYSDLELDYPNYDTLSNADEELLKDIVELWIEMQIFDIDMRNHDFTHYKTIFIILRQLFEKWFFEETRVIQDTVFETLQKYTSLCEADTSRLEDIQATYRSKLAKAQFRDESDFVRTYCEQEIEFFLSQIHSETEMKKQKKRFQSFLTFLSEKSIIDSAEYRLFWDASNIDGYSNLLFILLEKTSVWEEESDLKTSVWSTLREYYLWKNEWKYNTLEEYDQGFEYYIHKKSLVILEILVKRQVETSTEIIDIFLHFLYENNFFSAEEYQSYLSSDNMPATLCDIIYEITLGKYLSEYSELEIQLLIFLIWYYSITQNKERLKELQLYTQFSGYTLSPVQNFQTLELDKFIKSSDSFHHFLNIAMDLPDRIQNMQTRDFFEGEREVLKVLERFKELQYITETEFYNFQDDAFEISVFKLLKKIYFEWFFSGDINTVEMVRNTLISIAVIISPVEIWKINEYFDMRYTALMEKEKKSHIIPLAQQISEILQEWNEKQEATLIWDFVNILGKYDTSWNIMKLSGYGNSPRLVWFECLHFALIHHLLWKDIKLLQNLYYQVFRYYKVNNFPKRLKELQIFFEYTQEQWYTFLTQDAHEGMQWIHSLLKQIEMGFYGIKQIELIEKLVYSLFSQSYINEKERNVILTSKNSQAAFFNLYTILVKNWFLEVNEKINARIQQMRAVMKEILEETENPTQEDEDIAGYTPELRWEMIRSNTLQLIDWIHADTIWNLKNEYFEAFLWFLTTILNGDSAYSEIFWEEPNEIIHVVDKQERAHALLLLIYCDFLDDDFDTMEEVYLCLKEYYLNNKNICDTLEDIIHPYRILNQNN